MILRRLGNKKKIAKEIQKYFPPHKIYIEPFFGAGGMFFNKPKAKYNIVNDIDSDVYNLFMVVMNRKEELEEAFYMMPIHSDLLEYWKKNKETEPIKKALRFLMLKNLTFMGQESSLRYGSNNSKNIFLKNLNSTFSYISNVQFSNKDFREFLTIYSFKTNEEKHAFIYSDPPYYNTGDKRMYEIFKESDVIDLFNCLEASKCKFAYSEFDNPFILNQAKERGLNVITIGERRNLKNRRTDILITNYKNAQTTMF